MWKLGATQSMFHCYGENRFKKMKEYGVDCVDIHIEAELEGRTEEEFEEYMLGIKAMMDEAGVTPTQAHGPFVWPIHDETEELRAKRMILMKRSIKVASLMGIKNWVIHPVVPFGTGDFWPEEVWRINIEFFKELLPVAKRYGVTICLENMPWKNFPIATPEQSFELIRIMDDDNFKFCLDTGHAAVCGISPADAVRFAGKDLKALHVHDNDGKGDHHYVPCMGVIDWKAFVEALREIGYDGVFSFENGFKNFIPNASNDIKLKAFKAIVDGIMEC
ncbi:MAG: sugar phosphate isomerase/epimerase [Ruminococcaceae bacterium]|nr:sugar phosphate isomerase/epimerase [Oscillospiraceae bacterium]